MAIGSATGAASTFERAQLRPFRQLVPAQDIGGFALSVKRQADRTPAGADYVWPVDGTVVVVDLEYTAWEGSLQRGWSRPDEHREIVQIGAVRLDAGSGFAEAGAFEILVPPRLNPELSDYFISLTAITNERVASEGTDLAAALDALSAFVDGAQIISNGADGAVVEENCLLIGIANPLPPSRWQDMAPALQRVIGGDLIRSTDIPASLGLPAPSVAHDALADARAIAAGLRHLRGQGKI